MPSGTTPILIKTTNAHGDWGFVFRITNENGQPERDITYSLSP